MTRVGDWAGVTGAVGIVLFSLVLGAWVLEASSSQGRGQVVPAAATARPPSRRPGKLGLPLARNPQALALATRSRDLLVGLAATPGGPVDVLAIPGRAPVRSLQAWAGGRRLAPTSCGNSCFRFGAAVMRGRPVQLRIRVLREGAPAATLGFRFPARLPPSGERLLRTADRVMRSMRTVRIAETLTSGFTFVRVRYVMRAPDRLRFTTSQGQRTVVVRKRRWDWENGSWTESAFPGVRVPSYFWAGGLNARLLGRARLGAVPVRVLSLFKAKPGPAWFRLFIAPNRRVLRAEMLTESHFMTNRFSGFNEPAKIEVPA